MKLPSIPVVVGDAKDLAAWGKELLQRLAPRLDTLEQTYQPKAQPHEFPTYPLADYTSGSLRVGQVRVAFVRDGTTIYPVFADGVNWRKFSDNSIIA